MAPDQDRTQSEGSENINKIDMMSDPKATEGEDDDDQQTGADMGSKQKAAESLGLRDLPAEIRNKIYRRAIVTIDSPCPEERFIHNLYPPALTLVNKQIHAEALPIYYAENHFYLMLCAQDQGFYPVRDPVHFNRFNRMMEYFGRRTTSPMDQSPLRHIKNIVVQVKLFSRIDPLYYSQVYSTFMSDDDLYTPEPVTEPMYSSLCIRGEQQRMTFTGTNQEPFDPTRFRWHQVAGIWAFNHPLNGIKEVYDLVKMSFTGRTQPIDEAIRHAYHHWQSLEKLQWTLNRRVSYGTVDSPDRRLVFYDYR